MSFGPTPTDGSSPTPLPMSTVVPDGSTTPTVLEGGPAISSAGNSLAPASMWVKDGNDVTQGQTNDAAVTGDVNGTISAKLRGLSKMFADMWDSVNHRLKVDASGTTVPVSGTFWQTTQPVSGTVGTTADTAIGGTTAPGKELLIAGKTNDGTPQYQPLPEGAGGRSVIVEGIGGGTPVPVSGTVTANAGSGTFTNQQSNVQSDYDTGAGTQNVTMQGIALPASGGAVPGGTSTNPVRTDPTGTTIQPVSGTVTANAGTSLNTSLLALESGGNLASIKTDADSIVTNTSNINTATGVKTDSKATDGSTTAWSVIALLKGIIDKLLSTLAVTQSGTWTVQPGNTANTTPWLTSPQAASSGGSIPYHNLSAATTNFTNVKGVACQMYGCDLSNTSASTIFVKFYDKATAPGTGDVPKRTIQVPANATVIRAFPLGLKFTNGFGWAATGAVGDSDNTAIAANCVIDFDLNS